MGLDSPNPMVRQSAELVLKSRAAKTPEERARVLEEARTMGEILLKQSEAMRLEAKAIAELEKLLGK